MTGGGPGGSGGNSQTGLRPFSGPGGGGGGAEASNGPNAAKAGGAGFAGKIVITYKKTPSLSIRFAGHL